MSETDGRHARRARNRAAVIEAVYELVKSGKVPPSVDDVASEAGVSVSSIFRIFDGLPDSAIAINMGSTLTYYYHLAEPGTFMYHCHVEATEHMQMGMLGNLYVTPVQDGTSIEYPPASGRTFTKFAYNDGDGSTGYDVDFPIQILGFDRNFHDEHIAVQPLPFQHY